jgi:hypothetical protein
MEPPAALIFLRLEDRDGCPAVEIEAGPGLTFVCTYEDGRWESPISKAGGKPVPGAAIAVLDDLRESHAGDYRVIVLAPPEPELAYGQ